MVILFPESGLSGSPDRVPGIYGRIREQAPIHNSSLSLSSERKRFLQVHSAIVARRNAAIFDYNAWPKMGGEMPRAPREQYE